MKTEKEIRKVVRAVRRIRDKPCKTTGCNKHVCLMCLAKQANADNALGLLTWVLGENANGDRFVEEVMKEAAQIAAPGN